MAGQLRAHPVPNQGENEMPFANLKVPAGTLSAEQKQNLVNRVTDMYVKVYGERARSGVMVLVDEVVDGGWGIGGHILTKAMLEQRS
jgi:4-oxalocrotonate tautomerase